MAKKLEQQIRWCRHCKKKTLHYRNNKQISWILHILLILITGGIWLIVFVGISIIHLFTKPLAGSWTCSQCGQ